jgi:starvation-inducible DNA-binding protein
MQPQIGITAKNLANIAGALSKLLADEFLLYTKTRNAHWNVEGPDFHAMHLFFESQYEQLDDVMDEVAERIRMLGHYAPATMKEYLQLTRLTEASRRKNDSQGFIKDLLADHEAIITSTRESIDSFSEKWKDEGTADFVTGLVQTHEKMAWMLRAHLK